MTEVIPERTVVFRTRLWWAVLLIPMLMVPALGAVWAAISLALSAAGTDWRPDVLFPVAGAVFGGIMVTAIRCRRRPAWVRVSDHGIELSRGGEPIFVAWANVASATVRRWGVLAVLDVVPVALDQVAATVSRADLPPVRRLRDGAGFRVDLGDVLPRPKTLRRVLSDYRPSLPQAKN